MKKNKKNLFFKRYGIEIFVVVTIVALLTDIETNPENMFAGFWMHIKLYDKISIVAMLVLLVVIGNLLRDILKKWFDKKVHSLKDIHALDEEYLKGKEQKKKAASRANAQKTAAKPNKFNNFDEREYNMSDLERRLVQQ